MKLYNKYLIGAVSVLGLASCTDYLDVNTNPNSPSIEQTKYEQLLPSSQFYMNHIYNIVGQNASFYTGNYMRNGSTNELYASRWFLNGVARGANAQQWFYTMVGNSYKPMYEKSMEAGAYHFAGIAKMLKAWGYIMEVDLFGEVPYYEAFGEAVLPKFDTGDVIYKECFNEIDEAIELLSRTQEKGAVALSAADYWNGGDTQKWIKACYLLKARWMNHLSKKSAGSYKDLKYDEAAILDCLAKAQQSNADNTIVRHQDNNTNSTDHLWNEPVDYNPLYSCVGMNTAIYATETLVQNLTNFDGKGIEDPRANKYIPWTRSVKSATTDPSIVWTADGKWRRSLGVNMQTPIINDNGPQATLWNADEQRWYTALDSRQNDTVYVFTTCGGTGYYGGTDPFWRRLKSDEASSLSGIWSVRPTSPSYVASYAEACFIKAEVLMRKGDKSGAYTAYVNGVRASIDDINDLNANWRTEFSSVADNPTFTNMTETEINAFINGALGTAADLTMGKIMTQKLIAMPFNMENWCDMRRFDYDQSIFMNWAPPFYYTNGTGDSFTYCPLGKHPRRWKQASYEYTYNLDNLIAIGAEVPGAYDLPGDDIVNTWWSSQQIMTLPVFWDRAD
ncbi:MAG: SusD/RagB family nutrient-binding outer membrane lipoprotein [Muribaculaceae bacterium]|nr:SusD/RagB family nutrient-binding outer membrane lipoprotein [Muribaculaceae bacterium]